MNEAKETNIRLNFQENLDEDSLRELAKNLALELTLTQRRIAFLEDELAILQKNTSGTDATTDNLEIKTNISANSNEDQTNKTTETPISANTQPSSSASSVHDLIKNRVNSVLSELGQQKEYKETLEKEIQQAVQPNPSLPKEHEIKRQFVRQTIESMLQQSAADAAREEKLRRMDLEKKADDDLLRIKEEMKQEKQNG